MRVLMITQKVDLDDDILGFTHTWVNKLAERVERLYVLTLSVGRTDLHDNVELFSMGKERGYPRWRRWIEFNRVTAPLILKRRVDVIFSHMIPRFVILAAPYAKLMRIPTVLWYVHRAASLELRLGSWLADRITTATADTFPLGSDKVVTLGHGIDVEQFSPNKNIPRGAGNSILAVGRISPIKGYETLIEAAHILVNERGRRGLKVLVVGEVGTPEQRSYFESLKQMVERYGLNDIVQFLGGIPHPQVVQFYRNCDLLVNLSPSGLFDKAVLEAMACALPIITSNRAFEDMFGDGLSTLILPNRSADQLAERCEQILGMDEESRRALGKELRALVARDHNVNVLMERLSRLFALFS